MKTRLWLVLLWTVGTLAAIGQQPVPPPASPAEVAAGTSRAKFVSPYSLAQSGVSSGTAFDILQATNIPVRRLNRDSYSTVPEFYISAWNVYGDVPTQFAATNAAVESNNFMRWATNTLYWYKTNGMWDAGHRTIQFDDGWQSITNGVLTWDTNVVPMGIPAFCNLAHSLGFKVHLYSSFTTNTCNNSVINVPNGVGSPINVVYDHVQQMLSWGVDGNKFDTCDPSDWAGGDPKVYQNYITKYARIVNQAVADWNAASLATNGPSRAFWVMIPTTVQGPEPNIGTLTQDLMELCNVVILNWGNPSYSVHGESYLTNIVNLAKLSIASRDYLGRGCYPSLESYYANGQHNPGGTFTGVGGWTNFLNVYSAVCAPIIGTGGTWAYGTITNATASLNPNGGSPIKLLEVTGQYWTNRNFLEVYRDKAGIISKVAWSNTLVECWVRPLEVIFPTRSL